MLKLLGYWKAKLDDDYPCPHELEAELLPALRERLLSYLRDPPGDFQVSWMYLGHSWCRYGCELLNGSRELSDGVWVWPEGLAHYVEHHGLGLLPAEFLDRVESVVQLGEIAALPSEEEEEVVVEGGRQVDETAWIEWARQHRSAELTARLAALREPIARRHAEWLDVEGRRNAERIGTTDEACYTEGCPGKALRVNPFCGRCYAEALAVDSRRAEDEVLVELMSSYRK